MTFLKRLTGRGDRSVDQTPVSSGVASTPASLKWFLDHLEGRTSPMVLDLGVGPQRQLMNLVSRGYRATADDTAVARLSQISLPTDNDPYEVAKAPEALFRLDLPPGEYDGVLVWSSFDDLSYLGGFLLAREISRILGVGGVLTGTWSGLKSRDRAQSQKPGFTIVSGRGVHPMRFHDPTPCRYEVGEILALFPGFNLVHSMVHVDGTRRILLEKTSAGSSLEIPGRQS